MKKTAAAKAIDYAALIDQAGRLEAEVSALEPKKRLLRAMKDQIARREANLKPEETAIYDGSEYSALVSAQENETAICDMEAVFRLLGKASFIESCSMTLKALREKVTPGQFEALTKTERTGARGVKLLKRAA